MTGTGAPSLEAVAEAYRSNGGNMSATARTLGKPRSSVQRWVGAARDAEILGPEEFKHEPVTPTRDAFVAACSKMAAGYQAKQAKLDWRKPAVVPRDVGSDPFILWLGGDPHLDDHGADVPHFVGSFERLSVKDRVFGCNVGDFFNNWTRSLAFLWKEGSDPSAGWTIFEYLMRSEHGQAFLFAVSGNHDLWTQAPHDPIDQLCKATSTVYRRSAGHFLLKCGKAEPVKILMRHGFQGRSQYSNAHALKRAATFRQSDADILVGGHTHISEYRAHRDPATGRYQHLCQLGSFKKHDAFPVDKALLETEHAPEMWAVIEPEADRTERDAINVFYDFTKAAAHREAIS